MKNYYSSLLFKWKMHNFYQLFPATFCKLSFPWYFLICEQTPISLLAVLISFARCLCFFLILFCSFTLFNSSILFFCCISVDPWLPLLFLVSFPTYLSNVWQWSIWFRCFKDILDVEGVGSINSMFSACISNASWLELMQYFPFLCW